MARAQDVLEVSALPAWLEGQAGVIPPPVSGPAGTGQASDGILSPALKLPLNGYVSVWSQDCTAADGSCATPLPLVKNRAIAFELSLPPAPGQAQPGAVKEIFSLPQAGELSLTLKFYAVCPYAARSLAADGPPKAEQAGAAGTCPALYFQAQAELTGAAGAFCAAAFNEKDFVPFPVLICGGDKTRGIRFGITLHREKL